MKNYEIIRNYLLSRGYSPDIADAEIESLKRKLEEYGIDPNRNHLQFNEILEFYDELKNPEIEFSRRQEQWKYAQNTGIENLYTSNKKIKERF